MGSCFHTPGTRWRLLPDPGAPQPSTPCVVTGTRWRLGVTCRHDQGLRGSSDSGGRGWLCVSHQGRERRVPCVSGGPLLWGAGAVHLPQGARQDCGGPGVGPGLPPLAGQVCEHRGLPEGEAAPTAGGGPHGGPAAGPLCSREEPSAGLPHRGGLARGTLSQLTHLIGPRSCSRTGRKSTSGPIAHEAGVSRVDRRLAQARGGP